MSRTKEMAKYGVIQSQLSTVQVAGNDVDIDTIDWS